ncbi:MAG: polymerase LigD, ligase domain protein [Gemmatimonadetes bacterium]|nr:polymerase LigD, ligase domain protein [Gemmatimonadota bacterium]
MAHAPAPMLASPAGDLPALDGWMVEPKWDGIRVIADATPRTVHLWSRNGIDKAHQFPEVSEALAELARAEGSLTLDGELVAVDRMGKPLRFQALQSRHASGRGSKNVAAAATRTAFVAFDILSASGRDVRKLPWTVRREVLESVVAKSARGLIRRGDSYPCGSAGAKRLIAAAQKEGWEGLILKQKDAPYSPGQRSPLWRKVKLEHEQEFVIGGYTLPTEGADRSHLGALLVGYYDDDDALRYAGKVGTGYTRATLELLGKKLGALHRVASPFADAPKRREIVNWVKPKLVAQVRYNEMTASGILRQPAFQGLRDDKDAKDVHLEADTSRKSVLDALNCGS